MRIRSWFGCLLLAGALGACSGASSSTDGGVDADARSPDAVATDAPAVPLAGEIEPGVYRELVTIDAPAPPANPQNGVATPPALNRARFLRYRAAEAVAPVEAIIIAMPGMPAGAMAYDQIARRLVRLSQGAVELWAIDRRANLLEDLTGMQAAEASGDPDLAWAYYDEGHAIGGRKYKGLTTEIEFMSEWGLQTTIADLRAVLELVPAARRRSNVILVGHSFGAAFAQAFAAWDLDGEPASASLAGLALLDGGMQLYAPLASERDYLDGVGSLTGLDALRSTTGVYLDYFGVGEEVFMTVEVTAMRAYLAPEQETHDRHTDRVATLLFRKGLPRMTAAAMVGFALDDRSSPMPGMRASCGAPDGPVEAYEGLFGGEQRWRPARDDILYGWNDFDRVEPAEKTSIAVLSRVAFEGPTNRIEWYMPRRLQLDVYAVSGLDVVEGDWRWKHELRASRNAQMDAPVLVVSAGRGIVPSAASYESYRMRIAPQVGAGRPRAGVDRVAGDIAAGSGFAVLSLGDFAHDDVVHAVGPSADAVVYRPLLQWVRANVDGEVSVSAQ